MLRKGELRRRMRARLARLAASARRSASRRIVSRLCRLDPLKRARSILFFWPKRDEPDVRPAIRWALERGKLVLLPRLSGPRMTAVRVRNLRTDLEPGPFGLRMPRRGLPAHRTSPDVVLVPGLAFDRRKHRLGRGRAYFDRFLARHRRCVKVGVAFSFQIVPRLPVAPHDICMDLIVTDKGLL